MRKFTNKFHTWQYKTYYFTEFDLQAKSLIILLSQDKLLGLDIETAKLPKYKDHLRAGLCPHLSKIRLIQFYDGQNVYIFDLFTFPVKLLYPLLRTGKFCSHNGVFEVSHIKHLTGIDIACGCSMLMSQLVTGAEVSPKEKIDPELEDDEDESGLSRYRYKGHSLAAVCGRIFGVTMSKGEQMSDWAAKDLTESQITYAGLDAVATLKLSQHFLPLIRKHGLAKSYKLLRSMQHVVAEMQTEGIPVDWEYHAQLIETWKIEEKKTSKEARKYFGDVNIASGKQRGEWLTGYLHAEKRTDLLKDWPRTSKGAFGFSKTVVYRYKFLPAIDAMLKHSKWAKLISTYGESLVAKRNPVTSRLHPGYTLADTTTGRMSSREPNAQNFPSDETFRNMFAAPAGHKLIIADFKSIELRLQAEFSQDPVMLKIFRDGLDPYCQMAEFLFGHKIDKEKHKAKRKIGKQIMLSLAYGMGPVTFMAYAENADCESHPESFWRLAHRTYHTRFSVYSDWCNKMRSRAENLGYIDTILGKRRKLAKNEIYTVAPNTCVQGSAAHLLQIAMLDCSQRLQGIGHTLASIHDESMLIAPSHHAKLAATILETSMNNAMTTLFPKTVCGHVADAIICDRWGEAK